MALGRAVPVRHVRETDRKVDDLLHHVQTHEFISI